MKRIFNWQVVLGLVLVILSAVVYLVHYLVFRDAHHIFIYLLGDVAFVFLEVLLVSLIIHGILVYREKQIMLKKLNMVIGVFFSEIGTILLKKLSDFDLEAFKITKKLVVANDWSNQEFLSAHKYLKEHTSNIDTEKGELEEIKKILLEKRGFLLNLLGNPNLLEHDSFTDLLFGVFHLTEELVKRKDFKYLPQTDYQHLAGDIKRAYHLLIFEWLNYMKYLKYDYPYLFSLAIRTNPFDAKATIEVK